MQNKWYGEDLSYLKMFSPLDVFLCSVINFIDVVVS